MTEVNQVNGPVRQHLGPLGRFVRIECPIETGVPDWHFVLRRRIGWLEAKVIPPHGRAPKHFTLEQLAWGEEEVRWNGRWFLLGLRLPRTWVLHDVHSARLWFERKEHVPLLEVDGAFPTNQLVVALSS